MFIMLIRMGVDCVLLWAVGLAFAQFAAPMAVAIADEGKEKETKSDGCWGKRPFSHFPSHPSVLS